MFGWLIKNEVNDDAVRLKVFADMVVQKYTMMPFSDAKSTIIKDIAKDKFAMSDELIRFRYSEVPDFVFELYKPRSESEPNSLFVHGSGKYAGFFLNTGDGGKRWFGGAEDKLAYHATGGARKLISIMEKKFGVCDMQKLQRLWR